MPDTEVRQNVIAKARWFGSAVIALVAAPQMGGCRSDVGKPGASGPLTEEKACKIVWNLPEVRSWASDLERVSGGRVHATCYCEGKSQTEAPDGKQVTGYHVYVGESHETHTVRWYGFVVDARTGTVTVCDGNGRGMSLALWRRLRTAGKSLRAAAIRPTTK